MGQVLTRIVSFNSEIRDFKGLMDKVSNMPNVFDIRRKEYIEKNKFLLNFSYKEMIVENTGLFRTTSFARFQVIFTLVDKKTIQLATEYGFIGSASTFTHADQINTVLENYLKGDDRDTVVDVEFNDAPVDTAPVDFVSSADKLLKAKELYDKGAISYDDYEQLKKKFMEDSLK